MNHNLQNEDYLKVLLVDDDLLMLEDLQRMLHWESLGFRVCAVAENGKTALDYCERCLPDLVITDISMPLMDGLELIENIRQRLPEVQIVLLTAYSDFDYAKRAISFGVSEYLLKHEMNRVRLEQTLLSVKEKIQKDTHTARLHRRNCLETFLCAPGNPERQEAFFRELRDLPSCCWGVFLVGEPQKILSFTTWKQNELPGAHNHLREQMDTPEVLDALYRDHKCRIIAIPCQGTQVLVVAGFENHLLGKHSQFEALQNVAQGLWRSCTVRGGRPTVLYADEFCTDPAQINTAYLSLIGCYRYTIFGTGRQIVSTRAFEQKAEETDPSRRFEKGGLPSEIPYEELQKFLMEECEVLLRDCSLARLESMLETISGLLEGYLAHELCTPQEIVDIQGEMGEGTSVHDLYACAEGFFQRIYASTGSSCSLRVRKAIQFICQKYMLDIGIEDAAAELGLNGEYLNKVFKREVGVGFSRYLTSYRMKVAKKLLLSGECRIGEVAELVGYRSIQYFSVAFRQEVGEPPSAFAKRQ